MKLYISEYAKIGKEAGTSGVRIQAPAEPAIATQTVPFSGTSSLKSKAFNAATRMVHISTDTTCCIAFGKDPKAVAGEPRRLVKDYGVDLSVNPGDCVAVIASD